MSGGNIFLQDEGVHHGGVAQWQSKRLIIAVSRVQFSPSLPGKKSATTALFYYRAYGLSGVLVSVRN